MIKKTPRFVIRQGCFFVYGNGIINKKIIIILDK